MKLGYCNCCGAKIGRRTANGRFMYNANMRQICVVVGFPNQDIKDEEGNVIKAAETRIHLPVCPECLANPDYEKIVTLAQDNPDCKSVFNRGDFVKFETDPVIGGQLIYD